MKDPVQYFSGRPNRPEITSDIESLYSDQFNLTWTVESYSEITAYRIIYRKYLVSQSSHSLSVYSFPASRLSIYYFYKQTWSDFLAGKHTSLRHQEQVAQHRPPGHQPEAGQPAPGPQSGSQQADRQLRLLRPGAQHQVRGEAPGQEPPRLEPVLRGLRLHHEVQRRRSEGVTCGDSPQQQWYLRSLHPVRIYYSMWDFVIPDLKLSGKELGLVSEAGVLSQEMAYFVFLFLLCIQMWGL